MREAAIEAGLFKLKIVAREWLYLLGSLFVADLLPEI